MLEANVKNILPSRVSSSLMDECTIYRGQELGNGKVYLMRVRVNVSSYLMGRQSGDRILGNSRFPSCNRNEMKLKKLNVER